MRKTYIQNKKGFTLIELLAVIAITILVLTFIMTTLSSSRQKAVDASVKFQVRSIADALYLARDAATGAWPGADQDGLQCLKSVGKCFDNLGTANPDLIAQLVPTYIPSIPTPPNPPFWPSKYLHSAYVYIPNYDGDVWGPPGAYIIWGQTVPIASSSCSGYTPAGALPDGMYYCYQYLGR